VHRDFSKVCGLSESIQRGLCIVERSPRTVEYVCLGCGAQGLIQVLDIGEDDTNLKDERLASILRCPRCDGKVIFIERKGASIALTPVHAG